MLIDLPGIIIIALIIQKLMTKTEVNQIVQKSSKENFKS